LNVWSFVSRSTVVWKTVPRARTGNSFERPPSELDTLVAVASVSDIQLNRVSFHSAVQSVGSMLLPITR